jgi:hypothetical protein
VLRAAFVLVLTASALAGATASASAEAACPAGARAATVSGKPACIKAGQTCLAKRQADYARAAFVCRSGRLRPKATTTVKQPVIGPGSSRSNPVPLGKPGNLGNGWRLTVTAVNTEATSTILAADPASRPPLPDYQYVLVSVSATYTGAGSSHLTPATSLHAIGESGYAHSMANSFCGTLPAPNLDVSNPLTFKGGTIAGNAACWMVAKDDVASLLMYHQPPLERSQVWFALH